MAKVIIDNEIVARASKDSVVLIAGGTGGIGESLVQLFHNAGAHVFFSDISEEKGRQLERRLRQNAGSLPDLGLAKFIGMDVRDYDSQLNFFDAAFKQYERVDVAVYCVGISDPPGWMGKTNLNLATVREQPKPLVNVLDINLTACLYFSRIATAYLREGATPGSEEKSLTLISSANGILDAPGLYAYAASKAGMLGLLRSFRTISRTNFGFRVNVVCPMATDTPMIAGAKDFFAEANLPVNSAEGCAKIIQQVAVDTKWHGEAVVVVDNQGFGIENGLRSARKQWMGEELMEFVHREQAVLNLEMDWGDTISIE